MFDCISVYLKLWSWNIGTPWESDAYWIASAGSYFRLIHWARHTHTT